MACLTDKDSCGAQPPHNGFPAESLVERHAGQSSVERFTHCTCVWGLRQVPSQDAVPGVWLMEMSVRQRHENEALVVVSPSCKTGLKRQSFINLTARLLIVNSEAISQIVELSLSKIINTANTPQRLIPTKDVCRIDKLIH